MLNQFRQPEWLPPHHELKLDQLENSQNTDHTCRLRSGRMVSQGRWLPHPCYICHIKYQHCNMLQRAMLLASSNGEQYRSLYVSLGHVERTCYIYFDCMVCSKSMVLIVTDCGYSYMSGMLNTHKKVMSICPSGVLLHIHQI